MENQKSISRRPVFENGNFYHAFNRGVEKRKIFNNVSDYHRITSCLFEMNNKNPTRMKDRFEERYAKKKKKDDDVGRRHLSEKTLLVEIVAFCFMPNHYHLILRQLTDGGISLFMKKFGDSYVKYFNQRYERVGMGSLFQGKFKAVHVENDNQLRSLVCYILANPIEILDKNWREGGVKDIQELMDFLRKYRWSSYQDYIGIKNFPSVTKRDFLLEFFGGSGKIEEAVEDWVRYKEKKEK